MDFKIVNPIDTTTRTYLFYTIPTLKAEQEIYNNIVTLCDERVVEMYGHNSTALKRLKEETETMYKSKQIVEFEILRKFREASEDNWSPMIPSSYVSSSFIAYLMGISNINPLPPHYICDCCKQIIFYGEVNVYGVDMPEKVCDKCNKAMRKAGYNIPIQSAWGDLENPRISNFETKMSPKSLKALRSLLYGKLNKIEDYGKDGSYKKIVVPMSINCKQLGDLNSVFNEERKNMFSNEVYLEVLKEIAKDLERKSVYGDSAYIAEALREIKSCNFKNLCRIWAYVHGTFLEKVNLEKLKEPDFFVTIEEFFNKLKELNMSDSVALEFVKNGVWSRASEWSKSNARIDYEKILESYGASIEIKRNFNNTANLFPEAYIVNIIELKCLKAWYKIYHPEEFNRYCNE